MMRTRLIGPALSVGGAFLILISMFALPWVSIERTTAFLSGAFSQVLLDNLGDIPEAQAVINLIRDFHSLTGWQLVSATPTVAGGLRAILLLPLVSSALGLAAIAIRAVTPRAAGALGLAQTLMAALTAVLLFSFSASIRALGLDPQIVSTALTLAGITVGWGYWVCLTGLLLIGIGGILLPQLRSGPVRRSSRASSTASATPSYRRLQMARGRVRRPARRTSRGRWRVLALTLLVILLFTAGWWAWQQSKARPTSASLPPQSQPLFTVQPALPSTTVPPAPESTPSGALETTAEPPASAVGPTQQIETIPLALADSALDRIMLEAINTDRRNNELQPVTWDATAANAGALHAADMAEHTFFSHWDQSGHGPEYRYTQSGGRDSVMENIYLYSSHYDDGRPALITDFSPIVRAAQESLMQSPGHRRNILTPEHTHVGVGFAYNPQTGTFYLVQEFVNHYTDIQPLPTQAQPGTSILIVGRLLDGASNPNINLTYQPFPQALDLASLNNTGTYSRDAQTFQVIAPETSSTGSFQAQAQLDHKGLVGLYSIRLWVTVEGRDVLANEWMIDVQ